MPGFSPALVYAAHMPHTHKSGGVRFEAAHQLLRRHAPRVQLAPRRALQPLRVRDARSLVAGARAAARGAVRTAVGSRFSAFFFCRIASSSSYAVCFSPSFVL